MTPALRPHALTKVPAVTFGFWVIKILATTLGETAGDTVSMTLGLGYLASTAIFLSAFLLLVTFHIRSGRFNAPLYWATIVASTTAGTTMADFADRSLGIGYAGSSTILLGCVVATLVVWRFKEGSVSVSTVDTRRVEAFYWATITISQTLGTALGDWTADDTGLGYSGAALLFGAGLALTAAAYFRTNLSRAWLFWIAFILTRPLGATVGDFLDKPVDAGGLAWSRPLATVVIAVLMVICITAFARRTAYDSKSLRS